MSQYIRYNGILYRAVDAGVSTSRDAKRAEKEKALRKRYKELRAEEDKAMSLKHALFEAYSQLDILLRVKPKDLGLKIIAWAKHQIQTNKAIWSYKTINLCIKVAHENPANLSYDSQLCKALDRSAEQDYDKSYKAHKTISDKATSVFREAENNNIDLFA